MKPGFFKRADGGALCEKMVERIDRERNLLDRSSADGQKMYKFWSDVMIFMRTEVI